MNEQEKNIYKKMKGRTSKFSSTLESSLCKDGIKPEPQWYGADPGPERPARTSYSGWGMPNLCVLRNSLEYPIP